MSPIDKLLLEKYIKGECTPGEETIIHKWLDQNDIDDYPDVHKEKKYEQKVIARWRRMTRHFKELRIASSGRRIFLRRHLWTAAASLLLIALSAYMYYDWIYTLRYEKQYQTTYGEVKRINLDDGTIVTLNARSTLEIGKDFNSRKRLVYLVGEAYFKIKHKADIPFIVQAGKLSVTALGTAFDLSAFPDDPEIAVSLKEGKVLVKTASVVKDQRDVVLMPGEEAVYQKNTNGLEVNRFNPKERLSWQGQEIYFENAGIQEVLRKLERFYGVSFDTRLLKPHHWELTGEYTNQTLEDVLESLSFNYNLKYKIVGKKVILYEP